MLGKRLQLWEKSGGNPPANTQKRLIDPRNAATHEGANPTPNESYDALLIAAEIVEAAYPLASFQ
jgi:hypothetical protein